MQFIQLLIGLPLALLLSVSFSALLARFLPQAILIPATTIVALGAFVGFMKISRQALEQVFYPRMQRMAQELDAKQDFNMGLLGFVFRIGVLCGMTYTSLYAHAFENIKYFMLALTSIFFIIVVRNIAFECSLSPWYKGPMLSASPEGIRAREWFIPWSDVIEVVGSSNREWRVYINTTKPSYVYSSLKNKIYSGPNQVAIRAAGALPEALAEYLNSRAKLQNRKEVAEAS